MDFYYFQRFYGKSLPFGNKSFPHPYVGLLSIEQALGDYAVLLSTLKQELNATSCPVITFGGRSDTFFELFWLWSLNLNLVNLVNLVHINKLNLRKINEIKGAKLHFHNFLD